METILSVFDTTFFFLNFFQISLTKIHIQVGSQYQLEKITETVWNWKQNFVIINLSINKQRDAHVYWKALEHLVTITFDIWEYKADIGLENMWISF